MSFILVEYGIYKNGIDVIFLEKIIVLGASTKLISRLSVCLTMGDIESLQWETTKNMAVYKQMCYL